MMSIRSGEQHHNRCRAFPFKAQLKQSVRHHTGEVVDYAIKESLSGLRDGEAGRSAGLLRQALPVCYHLYSLEGALRDRHWAALGSRVKKQLLDQVSFHEGLPRTLSRGI